MELLTEKDIVQMETTLLDLTGYLYFGGRGSAFECFNFELQPQTFNVLC